MGGSRYNRLQGVSPRVQTSTQDGLDALQREVLGPASRNGASQASNGVQTKRKAVPINQPTLIAHKLGRPYRGWNVALKNQGESFFCPSGQQYDRSRFICVQWNGPPAPAPPPPYSEVDAEFWVF